VILFSSPSSPGRTGDSLSLNKAILPCSIHVFLDSSTQNAWTKIFWKHHLPITQTPNLGLPDL
jgi:hypothetical protein